MKNTLVLSMMLCGSASLLLAGCGKDSSDDDTTSTTINAEGETGDGDGDPTTGDGDGDGGDGDGDPSTTGVTTFVPTTDIPAVSECDPFMQDCPEGEKCVPYSSDGSNWNANKCVSVTGSGAAGDTCTYGGVVEATDDCDENTHCWDVMDVDGMNVGVCTSFCGGTADNPVCDPGTSCLIANDGSVTLCITQCDPLLQDCGAGLACFWAVADFQCIFTAGDIPTGEPCGFINDCAAGNLCADAASLPPGCAGSACCTNFCDLADPTCADVDTECLPFFEEGMAPPGYEDVGICIIPGA